MAICKLDQMVPPVIMAISSTNQSMEVKVKVIMLIK